MFLYNIVLQWFKKQIILIREDPEDGRRKGMTKKKVKIVCCLSEVEHGIHAYAAKEKSKGWFMSASTLGVCLVIQELKVCTVLKTYLKDYTYLKFISISFNCS